MRDFTAVHAGDGRTAVSLSWQPPADDGGSAITHYLLSRTGAPLFEPRELPADTTEFVDSGLTPNFDYRYMLVARNGVGDGPAVSEDIRTTPITAPSPPRNLRATHEGDGSSMISLSWDEPAEDGGAPIVGYRLTISDGEHMQDDTFAATVRVARFHSLRPNTAYTIMLFATNPLESEAALTTIVTHCALAAMPRDFRAVLGDDPTSDVNLSWLPAVEVAGCPLVDYVLEITSPTGENRRVILPAEDIQQGSDGRLRLNDAGKLRLKQSIK